MAAYFRKLLVQTSGRCRRVGTFEPSSTTTHALFSSRKPTGPLLSWSTTFRFIVMSSKSHGLAASLPSPALQNGHCPIEETYQNAIMMLNTLQSNAATIAKSRLSLSTSTTPNTSLSQTTAAILLSGLSLSSIDNLPIIHVSGTKGKGMTCAFTESILRQTGLKTGFFSSPHLTSVRERIRINGQPISESQFTRVFFSVYHKLKHLQLEQLSSPDGRQVEMPHYFRFIMIMAFHVFLEESVDVAILEVGIGGKFDSTNFIRRPSVVGITSLGLEHQSILGSTLEEIAVQKAGIMKSQVPAFTVHSHPSNIQDILREHASSVGCPLMIVEPFSNLPSLGVDDDGGERGVSRVNASLAVYLANEFLRKKHPHLVDISNGVEREGKWLPWQVNGLKLTKWDGRFQVLEKGEEGDFKVTYYLDGAHTEDSLEVTLKWFERRCGISGRNGGGGRNLLVFYLTGDRDSSRLMRGLAICKLFDDVIFCPLRRRKMSGGKQDNWSALENGEDVLEGCRRLKEVWDGMRDADGGEKSKAGILGSVEETVDYIKELGRVKEGTVKVLVTGSLHLVGNFLSVLEPNK